MAIKDNRRGAYSTVKTATKIPRGTARVREIVVMINVDTQACMMPKVGGFVSGLHDSPVKRGHKLMKSESSGNEL